MSVNGLLQQDCEVALFVGEDEYAEPEYASPKKTKCLNNRISNAVEVDDRGDTVVLDGIFFISNNNPMTKNDLIIFNDVTYKPVKVKTQRDRRGSVMYYEVPVMVSQHQLTEVM
jgi:hypothetical protein